MTTTRHTPVSGPAAILARRYAGALYELAEDGKNLDAVAADLLNLRQVIETDHYFIALARNPRLTRTQLTHVAKTLATTMKLNKLTGNFLMLTASHRRLQLLPGIIAAFLAKLAAGRGEFTAVVRAASALTEQQADQLATKLSAMAGGKVHLDMQEDKALLGGLTVRLGSRLIDASVKNKLDRLERKLRSDAA